MSKTLFDVAYGIADGSVDYSGTSVPIELAAAVAETITADSTVTEVAALVLRAMAAQRAVDLRLRDLEDDRDYSDCA